MTIEVVHEDEHLLVVAKPPFLATTSPDGSDCLVARVASMHPGALHPTSRLDAEVSGLVTFSKSKSATHLLIQARRRGRYGRLYLGMSGRAPAPLEGKWLESIGIDPTDPKKRRVVPHGEGRDAETRYRAAPLLMGALLHLYPRTGRTHQLRVHAMHHDVPLFGDIHYGGERRLVREDGRVIRAPRVMLHCAMLKIPRVDGPEIELRAPLPDDFLKVLIALGGTAPVLEL